MTAPTAHEIVIRPVVSEKSIDMATRQKYTFQVHQNANKIQIKAAVEELYATDKITVVAVNVLSTQPKTKTRNTRRGRVNGVVSGWRKAIVTLAPGQKIPFFEGG